MGWLIGIGCVVVLIVLPVAVLYCRRRFLTGQGGAFECSYKPSDPDASWSLGFARYHGEKLEWFRALGITLHPAVVWDRTQAEYVGQRATDLGDMSELYDEPRVFSIRDGRGEHYLAMEPGNTMGLLSWLESSPPGSYVLRSPQDCPPII